MSDFVLENASHSAIFLNTPGGGDFFANAGQVSIGPGSVGVLWADDSGVNISDVQITGGIAGVQISPSTGQFASWGFFHNVVAQNQIGTPWAIIPGVGGQVNGITADSCSAISGITNGVLVGGNGTCSSGSIVDGFRWIGGRISGNGYNGVEVVNAGCVVQNIAIQNSDISGNSATYTQLYNGVTVGAGISHFSVVGNRIGPDANQAERQAYAVVVPPGLSDYYIIVGNDLSGNLTGGLSNGGTGKHTAVGDNVGQ